MSKIHHFDEIHPCDENSLRGIIIRHGDENLSHMKLIGGMKFFTWVHIHNYAIGLITCDEFSSHWREGITINWMLPYGFIFSCSNEGTPIKGSKVTML